MPRARLSPVQRDGDVMYGNRVFLVWPACTMLANMTGHANHVVECRVRVLIHVVQDSE